MRNWRIRWPPLGGAILVLGGASNATGLGSPKKSNGVSPFIVVGLSEGNSTFQMDRIMGDGQIVCGSFAGFSYALSCMVVQIGQRAFQY